MAIHIHIGRQHARTRDHAPVVRRVRDVYDPAKVEEFKKLVEHYRKLEKQSTARGDEFEAEGYRNKAEYYERQIQWASTSDRVRDRFHKARDCACAECRDRRRVGGTGDRRARDISSTEKDRLVDEILEKKDHGVISEEQAKQQLRQLGFNSDTIEYFLGI